MVKMKNYYESEKGKRRKLNQDPGLFIFHLFLQDDQCDYVAWVHYSQTNTDKALKFTVISNSSLAGTNLSSTLSGQYNSIMEIILWL